MTIQPYHSNYHDHLCECPGCRPICQDDYDSLLAQQAQQPHTPTALENLPGCLVYIVLMVDEEVHTDERPFCSDKTCGCHSDDELFEEYLLIPILKGRLTLEDARRVFWGGASEVRP